MNSPLVVVAYCVLLSFVPNGHLRPVSPKRIDVFLDPAQRQKLITVPGVGSTRFRDHSPKQDTECPEAVVQADVDGRFTHLCGLLDDKGKIVSWIHAASLVASATIDPNANWEACGRVNPTRTNGVQRKQSSLTGLLST